MNKTGSLLVALLLAASMAAPVTARAQGLMSGTGMQPSTQLATPPSAPAIDQPGAEQRALAQHRRSQRMRATDQPSGTAAKAPATTAPR